MAAERIRVFIAGNIYVKRALVRRFLEDDGFEVVGEARNREDMVAATRREQPDALVVDDELLADGPGGGTMGRLRRAAPDSKVVVFTSTPIEDGPTPPGADAYLEKGLGLASLTALLGRLFAEPEVAPSEAALAETTALPPLAPADEVPLGVTAAAGVEPAEAVAAASSAAPRRKARAPKLVAMLAGAVLIVWGLGAMVDAGNDTTTRALDTTDHTDASVVDRSNGGSTPLDDARTTLDEMVAALRSGDYVLATVDARTLMQLRDEARSGGFALTGIDAEVVARLDPIVATLPTRVIAQLASILGELYPASSTPPDGTPSEPTSPSGVVLEPVTRGSTATAPGAAPPPATVVVGGATVQSAPAPAPQQVADPEPQPGDGKSWGQSHNPHGAPPGQTGDHPAPTAHRKAHHDGGQPPWAGGGH